MAKAPRPGTVKTRLHPLLGPAGAARLQQALIGEVTGLARSGGFDTWIAVDPPDALTEVAALVPSGVRLMAQRGADLGERMSAATADVFSSGPESVVVVGTDVPSMTRPLLADAFAALDAGSDIVLGPAEDGGYYLIGLAEPTPAVFALPPAVWGGTQVLDTTRAIARRNGLSVALLPALRDLDTPEDAAVLRGDLRVAPEVRALLEPTEEVS